MGEIYLKKTSNFLHQLLLLEEIGSSVVSWEKNFRNTQKAGVFRDSGNIYRVTTLSERRSGQTALMRALFNFPGFEKEQAFL